MRASLRKLGNLYIRLLGSPIRDEETGELLGRALIVVWRGRVHVVGFTGGMPLKPVFCSQDKVVYWRQSLGFIRATPPDYPRLRPE